MDFIYSVTKNLCKISLITYGELCYGETANDTLIPFDKNLKNFSSLQTTIGGLAMYASQAREK